jgi:hypothetical protein
MDGSQVSGKFDIIGYLQVSEIKRFPSERAWRCWKNVLSSQKPFSIEGKNGKADFVGG